MTWIKSRAVWMPEGRFCELAVEVQGDVIVGLAEAVPVGTPAVDLADSYLLPGLIDAHVHLDATAGGAPRVGDGYHPAAARARAMLQAGVTTVRDVGSPERFLQVRDEWNASPGQAPWILASGPPVTVPGGHASSFGRTARGEPEMIAAVESLRRLGCDVIKVMATAGGGEGGRPAYSESELRALVVTAHAHDVKVAAHAHSGEGIRRCVTAGVDSIEHASFKEGDLYVFDEEVAQLIAAHQIPVVLTPVQYRKAEVSGRVERMREIEQYWSRMYTLGVSFAIGTDVGVPGMEYDSSTAYSLIALHRAGLPAAEILYAAGPVTAGLLGLEKTIGEVAVGMRADLIAVPTDPTRDISAMGAVHWVMSRGLVIGLPEGRRVPPEGGEKIASYQPSRSDHERFGRDS